MATAQARICLLVGSRSTVLARQTKAVAPLTFEGHKNLSTNPQYKKPFPYEQKRFSFLRSFIDWTTSRLNDNSRIIQVEGPPCVGKAELAQKIANEFKLLYMPGIKDDDVFITNGFDRRDLNGARNLGQLFYDLDTFYKDPDPENRKKIASHQLSMYRMRYIQYLKALQHVLSTGQGVVLENSVWSDIMYADALFRHKHMSRTAYKYYKEYRHISIWEFWRPHLVIHLDAPTTDVMSGLLKRNPEYKDSPVLTEDYIDTVRKNFKEQYLPFMSESTEVLSYEKGDLPDFDLLAMDLTKLDLMQDDIENPKKFKHWRQDKEEQYSMYRHTLFNEIYFENVLKHFLPWDAPELMMTPEQIKDMDYLISTIPELKYSESYFKETKKVAVA